MKLDKTMIRKAIKARIDESNAYALYGRYPSTRWDRSIPEHHFYMRNHGLILKVYDSHGEIVDESGSVVARWERKWSTRKVCLTYKELMPTIEWVA